MVHLGVFDNLAHDANLSVGKKLRGFCLGGIYVLDDYVRVVAQKLHVNARRSVVFAFYVKPVVKVGRVKDQVLRDDSVVVGNGVKFFLVVVEHSVYFLHHLATACDAGLCSGNFGQF